MCITLILSICKLFYFVGVLTDEHVLEVSKRVTCGLNLENLGIKGLRLLDHTGADPGFDRGGGQIVTGLKLPFWGLSFVEFWCWASFLVVGGPGPPGHPPGSTPATARGNRRSVFCTSNAAGICGWNIHFRTRQGVVYYD